MKLEGGQISIFNLIILIIGMIIGTAAAAAPCGALENKSWMATLAGLGGGIIFALIYTTLACRFPKKNLIEINDLIYGKYLGKLISLSYLWYFLHIAAMVMRNMADFFKGIFMPETPMIVFILSMILLVCSATRNGLEVISRCAIILIPIDILTSIFFTIMLFPEMKLTNLLPLFDISLKDLLKAGHIQATLPFGEIIVLLMFFAFVKEEDIKKIPKATLLGITIAGIFLTLVSLRNISVLGINSNITLYPTFTAIRLINIGDVFTRVESFTIFTILSAEFIKMSLFFYGAIMGTAQIFNLRSYLPLVLPMGIIVATLSYTLFESVVHSMTWAKDIFPYYSLPFQIVLPLLSLLIAIIKKIPKEKQKLVTNR